jgi:hypothetical protein
MLTKREKVEEIRKVRRFVRIAEAQINRNGNPVKPREWFLVSLFVGKRSNRTHKGWDNHSICL